MTRKEFYFMIVTLLIIICSVSQIQNNPQKHDICTNNQKNLIFQTNDVVGMKNSPFSKQSDSRPTSDFGVLQKSAVTNKNTVLGTSNLAFHSSIAISGNAALATHADSGTGTSKDPYVIANKNIDASIHGYGIYIHNTDLPFILENNTIHGGQAGYGAIYLYDVKFGLLRNNTVYNNDGSGIQLLQSEDIVSYNNTVFSNAARGFYLSGSNSTQIYDNLIYDSYRGTYFVNSHSNLLSDNQITNNDHIGISLYESNNNIVYNNSLYENNQVGISLYLSANNNLSYNDVSSNMNTAIYLNEAHNNVLHKNTINDNCDDGINLGNSDNNQLTENILRSNSRGIKLIGSNNGILNSNKVQRCNNSGYILLLSGNNTLLGNIAYENAGHGFKLDADNNTLDSNIITHNSKYGVLLVDNTVDNIVKGNDFCYNNVDGVSQGCDNGTANFFLNNYWHDHSGTDSDQDGYIDTSYFVSGTSNSTDTSPLLVNPYSPSAPQQVNALAGSNYAFLNWSSPISNGGYEIRNFKIYCSTTSGTNYSLTATVSNTTFTYHDFSLVNGIRYYFVIKTTSIAGDSNNSPEVSVLPCATPSPPLNLQAVTTTKYVNLSWLEPSSDGGSEVTGYKVYRSIISGSDYELVGTVDATTLQYTDTSILNNKTYYYTVRAVNKAGSSASSNEINIATPVTTPFAPTGINASVDGNFITIKWSKPSNNGGSKIREYKIYRSTISGSDYELIGTVDAVTLQYTDTSILSNKTYYYMVRAVNDIGEGESSTEVHETLIIPDSSSSSTESVFSSSDESKSAPKESSYNIGFALIGLLSLILIQYRSGRKRNSMK